MDTLTAEAAQLHGMKSLRARMERIMSHMSWDIHALAAKARVSRSAAAQWVGDQDKSIESVRGSVVGWLAAETPFAALWIATGEGPQFASGAQPSPEPEKGFDAAIRIFMGLPSDERKRLLMTLQLMSGEMPAQLQIEPPRKRASGE